MSRRLYPVTIKDEGSAAKLLGITRRDVPLVSVTIECDGGHVLNPRPDIFGRISEKRDLPGLTNLAASLIGEGPRSMTPLEWHRSLDRDAIHLSVDASTLHWTACLQCLPEDLQRGLDLAGQCLLEPGLAATEWKRIVKSYRASAKEQWAQPFQVVGPLIAVQVLGYGHPNAHPAHEKSYCRAQFEATSRMGENAFRGARGVCATIGGDIDESEGFEALGAMIRRLVDDGSGPGPGHGALPIKEPEPRPARNKIWILDHRKIDQVYFALGRLGVRAGEPDRIALRLANYMLGGGGFSSRLMARVRSEMGQTYGIQSWLGEDEMMGLFAIQSFTKIDNIADMLRLIDDELDAIRQDGFTTDELKAAQDHLHGALPLSLTSPDDILMAAAGGLRAGLTIDQLEGDWPAIRDTRLEQVNEAAHRLIGESGFHLALIGPEEQVGPQIRDRGDVAVFPFRYSPNRWQD